MLKCPADRGPVAGPAVHAEHDSLAELGGQHGTAAVPAAGVDGYHPLDRAVLLKQGIDDMRKPRGAIVGDDHRRDDVLGITVVQRQGVSACCSGLDRQERQRNGSALLARVPVNNTRSDRGRTARWLAGNPGPDSAGQAGRSPASALDGLPLQPAALPLGQAAPDAESLIVLKRVLQAV